MDHRTLSIKFLRATGLIPVKVRPKQKDPFPEWDPRHAAMQDNNLVLAELEHKSELNLGALFCGRYVDLDIDNDNKSLQAALDHFMPRTPYVWGRSSKPRSHRVYALHDEFDRGPYGPVLRYLKNMRNGVVDDANYSIELRGGKAENGLFSVLPGSVHPSGEAVEWANALDPTVGGAYVEISRLIRAMRLAVVAAMIAPYWQSGVRNEMSLALAGTLWRIRAATMAAFGLDAEEEAPEGYYVLDEVDAEGIFQAIMQIAGDDEGDKRSRLLNLKNTWRKLDGEVAIKVTGGKVLGELIGEEFGPKVVQALYRLLSDNDSAEQLEKMADQFVMWYGQGVLIDLHMVQNARSNPWMNRFQAEASLGGKNLSIGGKKIPLAKLLFSSSIIRRVTGLTFDPASNELVVPTHEGPMVNQWRGFKVEPCTQRVSASEVEPFISYVKEVIASGDEDRAHWVFAWMADMFINPSNKPGTAMVLVGVEGAGKTFLGEHILGKIIGPSHYHQTNSITALTHNFNTVIDNKIFLQCDEAIHSYQRDIASRLKSIITDESVTIEPKGINSYRKPNHMRFMFTSNEESAAIFISASPYERRFTVLRVSPIRARDEDYWKKMHAWVPDALPKIMRWLTDYKYERWLVMRPHETEAKRVIQKVGVDAELSWILARIAQGFPIAERSHEYWFQAYHDKYITDMDRRRNVRVRDHWPNNVQMAAIEDDFRNYVRGMGKQVYTGSLITTIKKVLPETALKVAGQKVVEYADPRSGQMIKGRIRHHTWPEVPEILGHLRFRYGPIVDDLYDQFMEEAPLDPIETTTREEEF